jgi:hypothetical protein
MTMRSFLGQRAWIVVLSTLACLAAGQSLAQDPRASTVQKAARDWLVLFDSGDVAGTRDAAGAKFRDSVDIETWSQAVARTRTPVGELEQRAMLSTKFDTVLKDGGPPGDFAVIVFRSSYAKRPETYETITLERERDGVWRVIGFENQ